MKFLHGLHHDNTHGAGDWQKRHCSSVPVSGTSNTFRMIALTLEPCKGRYVLCINHQDQGETERTCQGIQGVDASG